MSFKCKDWVSVSVNGRFGGWMGNFDEPCGNDIGLIYLFLIVQISMIHLREHEHVIIWLLANRITQCACSDRREIGLTHRDSSPNNPTPRKKTEGTESQPDQKTTTVAYSRRNNQIKTTLAKLAMFEEVHQNASNLIKIIWFSLAFHGLVKATLPCASKYQTD